MKRAGFTMIELIFVIVILGILSAVALPKFIGVSDQAKAGKCKSLVGTLNRTTLPAMWSSIIMSGDTNVSAGDFNATTLATQIDIPTECGTAAQVVSAIGGTDYNITFGTESYTIDANNTVSNSESPVLSFTKR